MEYIHSKNYIHRDVKPENFLVECEDECSEIYAIDFGLAKMYRDPPKIKHIPYKSGKRLIGTARYASILTHMGCEQSRRDDLEAVMYMCLYFMKGDLPWKGLKIQNKQDMNKQMLDLKQNTPIKILCDGLPTEIATLLTYVRELKFEEDPDYKKMQDLLKDIGKKANVVLDKNYDWVRKAKKRKKIDASMKETSMAKSNIEQEEIKAVRSPTMRKSKEDVEDKKMIQSVFIGGSNEFEIPKAKNPTKIGTKKQNKSSPSKKSCNLL